MDSTAVAAFEKLGLFYLGSTVDPETQSRTQQLLLYDSRDLLTHGFCVGMTGSGKTGLGIALLEEAALDGIPALIVDPKGDLANLALTFPELKGEDFRPWVGEDRAAQSSVSPDQFAATEAERWRGGLAEWNQDGERIRRLKNAADVAVYTPGSKAGIPVSILRSFARPVSQTNADPDALKDLIHTTTSGLLGLVGLAVDPLRSREHILVANILENSWAAGKDLDLGSLIQAIQSPPFNRLGVFELEAFYPAKERFELAMLLNNLLAAPGFQTWREGESLDIDRFLFSESGKPRLSVFSIAHLSDSERMFFITLLLNQLLGWMRAQSGTTSLRALLYIDEIFGLLPPVAEPPSKRPLLTLLKQARAFGLGVVLATQNPMDLDYKGLNNIGSWFIGRLQTQRDKDRLVEGLAGVASANIDLPAIERSISSLGKRVFLLHNVHRGSPVLFQTRWTLSYLAGPLTRAQIQKLPRPAEAAPNTRHPEPAPASSPISEILPSAPQVSAEIQQLYAPSDEASAPAGEAVFQPSLLATAQVTFLSGKLGISESRSVAHVLFLEPGELDVSWDRAVELAESSDKLSTQPPLSGSYLPLPERLFDRRVMATWQKAYMGYLARECVMRIWENKTLKMLSSPKESERDFRQRLGQMARERRDEQLDKLRTKYATKVGAIERRRQRALQRVEREQDQHSRQKLQTVVDVGATLLGALLGRRAASLGTMGRAATAVRSASRISKEKSEIEQAQQNADSLQAEIATLETQLREAADRLSRELDPQAMPLDTIVVRPAKGDILIRKIALLWIPYHRIEGGKFVPMSRAIAISK